MRKMNYPLTRTRCVLGRQGEHLTTLSECSNWDCPQQAVINYKIQSSNCNFPHPSLLDLSELFTNILTNIDSLLLLAPHLHIFSSSSLPTLPVLFTTLWFFSSHSFTWCLIFRFPIPPSYTLRSFLLFLQEPGIPASTTDLWKSLQVRMWGCSTRHGRCFHRYLGKFSQNQLDWERNL